MKKLIKQAVGFIGISGIGFIIDFIIYTILTNFINISVNIANMTSSFVGVSFVFVVSTRKLFINNSKINIKLKYIIYIIYQIMLISTVSYILVILKEYLLTIDIIFITKYINIIVKIIITPFTMLINFMVMKYLIEKI